MEAVGAQEETHQACMVGNGVLFVGRPIDRRYRLVLLFLITGLGHSLFVVICFGQCLIRFRSWLFSMMFRFLLCSAVCTTLVTIF